MCHTGQAIKAAAFALQLQSHLYSFGELLRYSFQPWKYHLDYYFKFLTSGIFKIETDDTTTLSKNNNMKNSEDTFMLFKITAFKVCPIRGIL